MGVSAFEIYLRTGRRVKGIEVKFNPWHDPDNGRFTFVGTGRYFPGGGQFGGGGASGRWNDYQRLNPRNPRNHSIYVVKRGDTLSRIAALRKGLRVSDLGWLNNIRDVDGLRVGQRLMVPNQAYLDAGRRTRTDLLNLAFYVETHGGRMPPDVAQVPSIEEQLNSNWRPVSKNAYQFQIDAIERPRRLTEHSPLIRHSAAPDQPKPALAALTAYRQITAVITLRDDSMGREKRSITLRRMLASISVSTARLRIRGQRLSGWAAK